VVSSLGDTGPGTLRDAIAIADGDRSSGADVIDFAVTGAINLTSELPGLRQVFRRRCHRLRRDRRDQPDQRIARPEP
jgi:hypothetical protein